MHLSHVLMISLGSNGWGREDLNLRLMVEIRFERSLKFYRILQGRSDCGGICLFAS